MLKHMEAYIKAKGGYTRWVDETTSNVLQFELSFVYIAAKLTVLCAIEVHDIATVRKCYETLFHPT